MPFADACADRGSYIPGGMINTVVLTYTAVSLVLLECPLMQSK